MPSLKFFVISLIQVLFIYHIEASCKGDFKELVSRNYDNSPKVGDEFNKEVISKLKVEAHGQFSPLEDFYRTPSKTYLVWRGGPQKGKIYQVFDNKTQDRMAPAVSVTEFRNEVSRQISELETLSLRDSEYYKQLNSGPWGTGLKYDDPLRAQIFKEKEVNDALGKKKKIELSQYILKSFYGTKNAQGIRTAAFRSDEHLQLIQEIESGIISKWITDQSPNRRAHTYLITRGFDHDIFYEGGIKTFSDANDPIVLTHATFSSALPGIMSERALVAVSYLHEEIPKLTGEGGRRGRRYGVTPHDVSFWGYEPNDEVRVWGGYGNYNEYLQYPIMFGISQSKAANLSTRTGTLHGEKVVEGIVDLEHISHIFVPNFMMNEIKEILKSHGYEDIQVLALGKTEN